MEQNQDAASLKLLGSQGTSYPAKPEDAVLETFPNPVPPIEGRYEVTFRTEEFTSLCPKTGQPDFGWVQITYIPKKVCLESKALKLYLFSFRQTGGFWERQMNRIARDLVAVLDPHYLRVEGEMMPRGGVALRVASTYTRGSWTPDMTHLDGLDE